MGSITGGNEKAQKPAIGLSSASWATSEAVRRSMRSNRRTNTKPELAVRRALHGRGLRFRKDYRIGVQGYNVKPDIVFTRARIALFVDGCFWHRCPMHASDPKANAAYWITKLEGNVRRDRRTDAVLRTGGWTVVRVWEHEDPDDVAERIYKMVYPR